VIWTNLNAQSVCTYQIWIFLILWCSACWEDSKDYKIVIFGHLVLKIWIKQANREFDSNFKIVANWTHEIWSFIVLLDSVFPKYSNEVLFVIFGLMKWKIWFLQDWIEIWFLNSILDSGFNWGSHVANSDKLIPFRVDQVSGPLDLKWSVWLGSICTDSVSDLLWANGSGSDGSQRMRGRAYREARVPARVRRRCA
jgi:hypothetical protein